MIVNFISKLLNILIHPMGIILLLLVAGAWVKSRRLRTGCYVTAAILFLALSNSPLYNRAENAWCDAQATEWPERHYTYCFIPGGLTAGYDPKFGTTSYREAVDRMHAAALFMKEGICDTIVISGDGASCANGGDPEGFARHAERLFGIDATRIKCERHALTTMQNFQYSIPMMQAGNCITVNSARYMARTRLCAELTGFRTDYFSVTHIFERPDTHYSAVDFLPNWDCLFRWHALLHEWFGYVWYRLLYGGPSDAADSPQAG